MDIAWIASDVDCKLHILIELHWIEWLSFVLHWMWFEFDSKLYGLVDLRWIVVSTPLPNGLPNGLQRGPT